MTRCQVSDVFVSTLNTFFYLLQWKSTPCCLAFGLVKSRCFPCSNGSIYAESAWHKHSAADHWCRSGSPVVSFCTTWMIYRDFESKKGLMKHDTELMNFWGFAVIFGMQSSPCKAVYHRYLGDAPTSVRARWVDPGFYPGDAQIFGSGGGLSVRVGGTVPEGCSDLGSAWMEHRSGLLRQSSGEVFEPYLFGEFWGLFSIGPVVCVEDTDLTTTWLWHTMAMPSLSLLNNWIIWCIHWQGQCFEHT